MSLGLALGLPETPFVAGQILDTNEYLRDDDGTILTDDDGNPLTEE